MAEAVIPILLDKVTALAQHEVLKVATAKTEMEKLEVKLKFIQPFLRDAHNKQFLSKEVKDWVWRLNEVAYDALDLIDLYRIKLRHLVDPADSHQSKVQRFFSSISKLSVKNRLLYETGTMIHNLNERFSTICEEKDQYLLEPIFEESSILGVNLGLFGGQHQKTSVITETKIIGREKDEQVVLKWLLEDQSNPHNVIAIVGMSGVGKTALAKNIYNNSSVRELFDESMWVCVSAMPNLLDLLRKIFEEVDENGSSANQFTNANTLCSKISNHLKNKKILLVLDDVWDLYGWWDELKGVWQDCVIGSKVLITTRQMEVAKAMGLAHRHKLKCLNEEQSWQLFVNKALRSGETEEDLDGVMDVGRDIARKCGGLPLALNAVGSLLQWKERRKSDWQDVLRSPLWNWKGPQNNDKVFAAIALSYMSIPFQLKQCLTYCCMYPKDFKMKKKDLVRFWVAEGFILKEEGVEMEAIAKRYLETLVGCSLIQDAEYGKYVLHDIIHDFALYIREKEFLSTDQLKIGLDSGPARYISLVDGERCSLEALRGQEKLRGLVCHGVARISADNFVAFKLLRVLDLSGGKFSKLTESIGDLILLKYLNLSQAKMFELPESITKLHELQTLDLTDSDIKRLPNKISALSALRHLDISGTTLLEYLPSEIGKLTCLQTLPKFIVGSNKMLGGTGSSLSELRELNHLRGSLRLENLQRVRNLEEVDDAQLKRKGNLRSLVLCCDSKCTIEFNCTVIQGVEQVYERIEPPIGIEKIKIYSYPGMRCPTWMHGTTYSCLREIFLSRCTFLASLPNFGLLPNLVDLTIFFVDKVKAFTSSSVDCVGGKIAFPKLESLYLGWMEGLEEWQFDVEIENMPRLRQLSIISCPRLRAMPFFSTLRELKISGMVGWEGWPMAKGRNLSCLRELQIFSCEKLKLLPDCPSLEQLLIDSCNELTELPRLSPVLVSATIKSCLVVSCPRMAMSDLKQLRHLEIVGCPKLESLLQRLQDGKLEQLTMEDCSNVISIPAATGLKSLSLRNLPQLQSLSTAHLDNMKSLEEVCLDHRLGSMQVEELLARLEITRLRKLTLSGFHNLGVEWLKNNISDMIQLEHLVIEDCPRLLLSIMDVLKKHPLPTLRFLKLSSLPKAGPRQFGNKSLACILVIDSLEMSNKLAGLVDLSDKVRDLAVKVLGGLNSLPEWIQQLHQLECLTIYECPYLTRLPHWLNKLRRLEHLEMYNLPELVELPATAIRGLHQLDSLHITSCPKMRSLPDGLSRLPRLKFLGIERSALLQERCRKEDRHKISNIPQVYLDDIKRSNLLVDKANR